MRAALREVDEDEGLLRGAHERVVIHAVGRVFARHAGAADPLRPHEDLEEVVEPGRSLVENVAGAHDELAGGEVGVQQAEVAQVLDPRVVEVGQIAPVVDDSLRVGVREAHAGERRVLERRLAVGRLAEIHGSAS